MSYEEYVNEEAMELTEENAPEAISAEEPITEAAEAVESVEAILEEPTAEQAEEEETVIQYSVEEPLTVPTVDEELFEASADEEFDFGVEGEEKQACVCDSLQAKCDEVRTACKDVISRLSNAMEQTNYNPYIRSTTTYKYEILKKSTDTEPVDVFEFQRTTGFSLRAMAITTVLVAAADVAVAKLIKKKMK
ncbi:MAG: hypothetical protein IKC59_02120 [Clostridia bacterium]|nr:hypothetical protein [Clostridia bacterium]